MDEIVDLLDRVFAEFATKGKKNYGTAPMPCDRDRLLMQLTKVFANGTPEERDFIIQLIDGRTARSLLTFSGRMAVLSVRLNSSKIVYDGLVALVIENSRDYREILMKLCLLNHSAILLGENPETLFAKAANLVDTNSEVARLIVSYPLRPVENKSLAAFEMKEKWTEEGFLYIPNRS